jgi:predicted RNA-binding Zn-ribbon protein involved in translation (DUF1610 family)
MAQTFDCPSCGAALEYHGGTESTIQCPYCGNTVIVPAELRSQPAAPPAKPDEDLVIKIHRPESGQGRPEISVNIPPQSPEFQQFQQMEQVLAQQQLRRVKRAGGCGCFSTLIFLLLLGGGLFFIFGLFIKSNSMYTCALTAAKNSQAVIQQIGQPMTAGFFAWMSNYESSGSNESVHFSTDLSGPKGSGTLDVYGTRQRNSLSLDEVFSINGHDYTVLNGPTTCR